MHTEQILWLFSWPVLILINYLAVRFALKKYENKQKSIAE